MAGRIYLRGDKIEIRSPKDAIAHGIGMVHQHFLQVNNFTVTANIVLGADGLRNRPTLRLGSERSAIDALSRKFGLEVDLDALIEDLPMGARQTRGDFESALSRRRHPHPRRTHHEPDAAGSGFAVRIFAAHGGRGHERGVHHAQTAGSDGGLRHGFGAAQWPPCVHPAQK